jgi:8-oxo-dGTP pyrophosphatase MutT (NUDIX family)
MIMAIKCEFAQKALIVHDGHVLLVRKSADDPYHPMKWEIPGGRRLEDESLDEHIEREVREEVGLDIRPGRPLSLWDFTLHKAPDAPLIVAIVRECTPVQPYDVSIDGQGQEDYLDHWKWVPLADVASFDLIGPAREPILDAIRQVGRQPVDR